MAKILLESTLRTATNAATLHEHCNCSVPEISESIVIYSASEDENEEPEMWVNNGAYNLNCRDKEVVLSRRGWLTDKIICAAQMILLQFFPEHGRPATPHTAEERFAFKVHSGEFVQIIHVRNSHWTVVSTVGSQSGVLSMCMTVCTRLCPKKLSI